MEKQGTKAEAHYLEPGQLNQRCADCEHYTLNACEIVAGPINPNARCEWFKAEDSGTPAKAIQSYYKKKR